jgi:hypothetical protein
MTVPGAAPPPEPLNNGPRPLGPFTLTAQIGVGRRTIAYLGYKSRPDDLLLIRELQKGFDPDVFETEVRGGRAFSGSTGAAEVIRTQAGSVQVSRAVVGESLATILEQAISLKKPVDLDIALAITMGIAGRLARAGERRFHGDLVPHHVLIGYDGLVHLIDPACAAHRERSRAPGRAGYRSPEHVRGDAVGPQSDVFMLGILLFEMTTALRLFDLATSQDTDAAIVEGRLPRPRDLVGDTYPIELQLVLRKLVRPSASGRFPDGAATRDALRLVAAARTEIAPQHIGGWLKRQFQDRHAVWRQIAGEAAGAIEEGPLVMRGRSVIERGDTVPRITSIPPVERTEPNLPISSVRPQSALGASKPVLPPRDGPTLVTQRPDFSTGSVEPSSGPMDNISSFVQSDLSEAMTPEAYATKLALENIESLEDHPRRLQRKASQPTSAALKDGATDPKTAGARAVTPPASITKGVRGIATSEAIVSETPTPLMDVSISEAGVIDPVGTPVSLESLFPLPAPRETDQGAIATPTPLLVIDRAAEKTPPIEIAPPGAELNADFEAGMKTDEGLLNNPATQLRTGEVDAARELALYGVRAASRRGPSRDAAVPRAADSAQTELIQAEPDRSQSVEVTPDEGEVLRREHHDPAAVRSIEAGEAATQSASSLSDDDLKGIDPVRWSASSDWSDSISEPGTPLDAKGREPKQDVAAALPRSMSERMAFGSEMETSDAELDLAMTTLIDGEPQLSDAAQSHRAERQPFRDPPDSVLLYKSRQQAPSNVASDLVLPEQPPALDRAPTIRRDLTADLLDDHRGGL